MGAQKYNIFFMGAIRNKGKCKIVLGTAFISDILDFLGGTVRELG